MKIKKVKSQLKKSEKTLKYGYVNDELFNRLLNGDKSARDEIIVSNQKLVHYICYKHFRNVYFVDHDDLFQSGVLGLIKAVDTYKPPRSFTTYAYTCIKNEILMTMRHSEKYKDVLSLDAMVVDDQESCFMDMLDSEKFKPDQIVNPEKICMLKEEKKIKMAAIDSIMKTKLKPVYSKILIRRYLSEDEIVPQAAVAKEFNYSQSYISRTENNAIDKMREILKKDKYKEIVN